MGKAERLRKAVADSGCEYLLLSEERECDGNQSKAAGEVEI